MDKNRLITLVVIISCLSTRIIAQEVESPHQPVKMIAPERQKVLPPADAPADSEVLVWTGKPLQISIAVRKDRVIKFNGSSRIQVGVPRHMQGIASAESIRGIVYLRSFKVFDKERFWFRDKDTQEIFVAEISAKDSGTFKPVVVVRSGFGQEAEDPTQNDTYVFNEDPVADVGQLPGVEPESPDIDIPVEPSVNSNVDQYADEDIADELHGKTTLVRYAFQKMYSPDRLVKPLNNVYEISVDRDRRFSRMFLGDEIVARPLAQWKNGHQFVTAFYLKNESDRNVSIDPRRIRGAQYWDASSVMSDNLNARDTYGDSTAMVVISDKRLEEYMRWLR